MTAPNFSTSAQDVVAVLDSQFAQVFEGARAIRATVSRVSKAMEHPLETGVTITDHRIILPIKIELSLLLTNADYRDVYQQVADLFKQAELLTVQTRVDSFADMLIEKMPHEETSEILDGVFLVLSLTEAKFVEPQFAPLKVQEPRSSNTVQRGQQQPKAVPPERAERQGSILSQVFK